MAVDIWDDSGNPIKEKKGELVCTVPFPSCPIGFWNDPDNNSFLDAISGASQTYGYTATSERLRPTAATSFMEEVTQFSIQAA